MKQVVVSARGIEVDGASLGWAGCEHERDPLAAAARRFVGARNARLPRLDRPTLAALVAAHFALEGAPPPAVTVVAVDEGCAAADRAYWATARGRGGLDASPSLFAATLPSAVAGELAMTFGLRGPCVVLAGESASETCGNVADPTSRTTDGGLLVVRLRGWTGDVDGEAGATSETGALSV